MPAELTIWSVFYNPKDYPGKWVLRGFTVGLGTGAQPQAECVVADTLDAIREKVPPGLTRLERHPDDDPVIFESWV